jgi:hypothetical protein
MKAVLLCLALVMTSFNQLVNAECLIPPPPCKELARAAIVAVVDVIEVANPWENDGLKLIPQVVRLRVVERFKGVLPQLQEITGNIAYDAESVFLQAGERYLLYTLVDRDGIWITSCSRTKLADFANAEVSQLRPMPSIGLPHLIVLFFAALTLGVILQNRRSR